MRSLLFAPHNDDETLWAAYTIIRHRPVVIVCFRSVLQDGMGITSIEREAETREALHQLVGDEEFVQWPLPDDGTVTDDQLEAFMWGLLDPMSDDKPAVFAPAVTRRGHPQHNQVGRVARIVFDDVTHYATYDFGGDKQRGIPVPPEPLWMGQKHRALACYRSQIERGPNRFFSMDLHEYVVPR